MRRLVRATALALAAVLTASVPVLAADPPAPSMENAGGATIVRQPDTRSSLAGVEIVVRAGLDRQTLKQNGIAALVAQTILRTPVTTGAGGAGPAMPLEEAVAAAGGSIQFAVDPDDVRFYAEALAADAPVVFDLVRRALAAPDFSPATVRDARAALVRDIGTAQQWGLQVGIDMLNAASARQANAGLPSRGTPASLAQLAPADAKAFFAQYYRRGGAVISAVGRLDALDPGSISGLAQALPQGSSEAVAVHVAPLKGTSRQIVTHRDVPSPWLIAQYPAPNIDSKDYGPMLVLAAFVKRALADVAQVPGVVSSTFASRAVGTVYAYDREPAHLLLYVNGGGLGNPTRTFATALTLVNVLAATRLHGSIDEFKAAAAGDFATGATTLETRAHLAAVFAQDGSTPDFFARTLEAIEATTPEDVQRVARTYLGNPTIALVLPRDGTLRN